MSTQNSAVLKQSLNMEKGKHSSEYLSKDMLDEDFLKMFSQYRRFQLLLGSCRVDARHRFVTAPTVFQKLYTIFIVILVFIINLFINTTSFMRYYNINNLYILSLAVVCIHYFFYFSSIIHARFICNNINVIFYVKLSQIDTVLKVDYNRSVKILVYKLNWINLTVLCFIICFLIGIVLFTKDVILTTGVIAVLIAHCTMLIEISYCSNLLAYFAVSVRIVNHIISSHLNKTENTIVAECKSNIVKYFLRTIGPKTYDFCECRVDCYLKVIFTAFAYFQDIYKFQIFLFTSKVVIFVVITFEFTLLTLQNTIPDRLAIIILSFLTATDVLGLLFLCLRCDLFEREIRKVKLLSIKVMSVYQNGLLRDRAKKIYKLIQDTPPRFSVYDMWELETSVFIKVCNVVTGFFVTLLQFTFL